MKLHFINVAMYEICTLKRLEFLQGSLGTQINLMCSIFSISLFILKRKWSRKKRAYLGQRDAQYVRRMLGVVRSNVCIASAGSIQDVATIKQNSSKILILIVRYWNATVAKVKMVIHVHQGVHQMKFILIQQTQKMLRLCKFSQILPCIEEGGCPPQKNYLLICYSPVHSDFKMG